MPIWRGDEYIADPIAFDYPELTPYQFASNTPVWAIDIDGLEAGLYGGMTLSTAETSYALVRGTRNILLSTGHKNSKIKEPQFNYIEL